MPEAADGLAAGPSDVIRSANDQKAVSPGRIVGIDRHAVMGFVWRWIVLVVALGIVHIILAGALRWNFAVNYLQFLDLDSEKSLPAWFSSLLLLVGGGLAAVHAWLERGGDDRMARYWSVLAILFVYLSLDEEAAIHEKLSILLRGAHLDGFFKYSWVLVIAPLILAGGFYFIPFLRRLPSPIGWRIFVAGCIYVSAAMGVEMIGGYLVANYGRGWLYWIETVVEESGEMIGAALFISAQLLSLERYCPPVTLHFLRRPG